MHIETKRQVIIALSSEEAYSLWAILDSIDDANDEEIAPSNKELLNKLNVFLSKVPAD